MAMEISLTTTYQIRSRVFSLFNFFRAAFPQRFLNIMQKNRGKLKLYNGGWTANSHMRPDRPDLVSLHQAWFARKVDDGLRGFFC